MRRHESLARHVLHRGKNAQIRDVRRADLTVHHMPASGGKVGHRGPDCGKIKRMDARLFCGKRRQKASRSKL
jgi:hypothetical protein